MKTIAALTVAVICGLALTACGGGGGDDGGGAAANGGSPSTGGSGSNTGGGNTSTGGSGGNGSGTGSGGQTSSYTVTPSVSGSGGSISPSAAVSVKSGAATSFQVTPNTEYTATVGGTCGGTLSGNTYTTNAITANCTVVATFTQTASSSSSASIAACFTAPNEVSFALGPHPEQGYYAKASIGPGTFKGQAVTVQTFFYEDGTSESAYWTITNTNVAQLGYTTYNGTTWTYNPPSNLPLNIQPGQSIDYVDGDGLSRTLTFVGFETLTLADKTFPNTCHFENRLNTPTSGYSTLTDTWYASGYGEIRSANPVWGDPSSINPSSWFVDYQYAGSL